MNDVSILVPLPAEPTAPPTLFRISGDGTEPLVSKVQFTAAAATGEYDAYRVVAIRFDLCDRVAPGPCPTGADGQMRLVLQPMRNATNNVVLDAAVHAFYPIPASELSTVINELRALARIAGRPANERIGVSPALLAGNVDYVARLRSLVGKYARESRLARLAEFDGGGGTHILEWTMGSIEREPGTDFHAVKIPGVEPTRQKLTFFFVDVSETAEPNAGTPEGLGPAMSACMKDATNLPDAMKVLSSIENPTVHTPKTAACAGCHVSTALIECATEAGVKSGPERFTSAFDTTIDPALTPGVGNFRAFGYQQEKPVVAQRTANDTAYLLTEIEARFPAPR